MKKIIPSLMLGLMLAACASKEPVKEPAPVVERTSPPVTNVPTSQTSTSPMIPVDPRKDPQNMLYKRSVYFDYDSNAVKDEFRPLIQAHAKYLVENRNARAKLEGNTDERGSREYNLALGQRRAEAVKKIMTVIGVPEARLETVSFGKEKPVADGHEESSWWRNRRTDVKYQGE